MTIPISGLISAPLPSGLADARTQNFAPGAAEIPKQLGGMNRLLYEMATGRSADTDGEAVAPRNGQYLIGVDHSGPPFGSAVLHPIAIYSPSYVAGSDWDRADNEGIDIDNPLILDCVVDVRGHAVVEGAPYSRGYVFARMDSDTASTTVTFRAEANGTRRETNVTQGTSTTFWDLDTDGDASVFYFDLIPGRNRIRLLVTTTHASATVDTFTILIGQIAKRKHTRAAT